MAKDPAFLFYYSDWLSSTNSLKADERGYYIQLLANQASLGSLPNDIEELANLAGVRFSEYEHFKHVFKHTLKAKFTVSSNGRLVNMKLVEIQQKRNNYSVKQSTRGSVGAKIKKAVKELNLNKSQQTTLRQYAKDFKLYETDLEKIETSFKHMLKAFIENEIENINKSKSENNGGVGEKEKQQAKLEFDLPKRNHTQSQHLDLAHHPKQELVLPFADAFRQTWLHWKNYLQAEHNSGYNSVQSEQASLKTVASLANGIEEKAISIVEQSMGNRWKTFYELKNKTNSQNENTNNNIYPDEFLAKHGLL
jgi:hypothetical protein